MRAEGPRGPDVASAIASGWGAPAFSASAYHRRKSSIGSAGASGSRSGNLLLRALYRHVLAQLLESRSLQARHVHLADPQPACDLRLGHLLVEPHGHDGPLTRRQVLHGAVEHVAHLDTFELRIRTADL